MKIGFWDIECKPGIVHSWGLFNQTHSLNQVVEQPGMISFAWRWNDSKKVIFRSVHHDGHQKMIEDLHALMDEADALVSWHGASFDTKHAKREFLQLGMLPPSPAREIDLLRVTKSHFRFFSNKLQNVAEQLGVGSKNETGGHSLWVDCMAGDDKAWRKMRTYNIQDVNLLVDLYGRLLPWIPNVNKSVIDGIPDGCVNCASTDHQRRGNAVTTTSTYARYQCQNCGKWNRGKSLLSSTEIRPA